MLALVLASLTLLVQPDTSYRPTPPPDTPTVEAPVAVEEAVVQAVEDIRRFRVRPVFSPSALYSPSKGFGIGGGIAVDAIATSDDHLQVEGRVSQHLLGAYGEYTTGSSATDHLYGLFGASGWTTSRTRFTGHGPRSAHDGALYLDRLHGEGEARLGWAPGGPRGLLLQPTLRLRHDRLRGYEESSTGGRAALLPDDRARLDALIGQNRTGVEVALSAFRDARDVRTMPRSGTFLQGEVARFQAVDGSGLGFTRVQATGYLFRPALFRLPLLPEPGAFFFRASGVVTRQDGSDPLPWFYLPELNRDLGVGYPRSEFVGRDALSLGFGLRGVIAQAIGALLIEGVAMTTVGAAYDDVFSEFSPRVEFSPNHRPAVGERVPLQPSLAIGANLHFIDRERPLVGALVGIGPSGVSFGSLRLVYGLDAYRPRLD